MTNGKLILASASPRRAELLTEMTIPFEIRPSKVDERQIMADHPRTFAIRAAYAKAHDVAARAEEGTWVLAADTVVTRKMILYGKPDSPADARRMLRQLSGEPHDVITALALTQTGGPTYLDSDTTRVIFRHLPDNEIDHYIATGEPMDKAGAYGIQGEGGTLIDHIEGNYYNVVGLPCQTLAHMLQEAGVEIPVILPQPPERWR